MVILHSDLYISSLFCGSFMVRNVIRPDSEVCVDLQVPYLTYLLT